MGVPVQLRHVSHVVPRRMEYFYDGGHTAAYEGLISLDSDKLEHLRTAYFRGYRDTFDGRRLHGFTELEEYARTTAESVRGTNDKGSDSRG